MSEDDATLAFAGGVSFPGYRVIRPLGHGGMGAVYLAEDEALGRRAAIKVIARQMAADASIRERFLREARLLATVDHPNVVRVYAFGATEERAYLAMEYVEGETLADRIQRGPVAVDEALNIVARTAAALAAAWDRNIVHRDIKPSNILFNERGELKVADFGLAKGTGTDRADSSLTQTGYLLGSPHYVAPEQAHGRDVDFRADIYSLGITLFEMVTGRRPFHGSPLEVVAQHLKEKVSVSEVKRVAGGKVAELVEWMTAKKPEDRPQSYAELIAAVDALRTHTKTIRAMPARVKRTPAFILGLLCLVAAAGLFVFFHFHRGTVEETSDDRLVVAVAPFWGPDAESIAEGRSMAALIQQQVVTRLGAAARVIGIDETKVPVRDTDSARALGERMGATAVIWGQAFALKNEREIQPSVTLVPRKTGGMSNRENAAAFTAERAGSELPTTPDALRVEAQAVNQIELRKTSAEGIGDLVTFVAATHALTQGQAQHALDLLAQARPTPDTFVQKARCLAQMNREDDATRQLEEALKLDSSHAPSLAMLADIQARGGRRTDAAATLRRAIATGRRFTTTEAALYNGLLYTKEYRYDDQHHPFDVATMLAIDPVTDHVKSRWELPGSPKSFSVDDTGMTVKCDIGPPRAGELMTLHFVNDHFEGGPLPHAMPMIMRLHRMRPGWFYTQNFQRELGGPGLKIPKPQFRYSPIDANPLSPKTLPEAKAALEKALERDPTQPWYRASLAITMWELGDHAGANRVIDEMFAQPNAGTPYYEFAWMIRHFEPLGHRDWADRAFAEALKRRKAEVQPITMTATFERMLSAPFIRRTANISQVAPDPPRDHLWLERVRELSGISWDGDQEASAAWARYFRAHGDTRAAAAEDAVYQSVREKFGGTEFSLALMDVTRAAQIAITVAMLVAVVFGGRRSVQILAILLVAVSAVRLFNASRARQIESIPVPYGDSLGHPITVATLEEVLTTRDKDDLRFITGVAHQLAGDPRRAAELYRTVDREDAADNLRSVNTTNPDHLPDLAMLTSAFFNSCPYELWETIKAAWGTRPAVGTRTSSMYAAAYEASQAFYVLLLIAAGAFFFVIGRKKSETWRIVVLLVSVLFMAVAYYGHRTASASVKVPVTGKYAAMFVPSPFAYPFPPDPTSDESMKHALGSSDGMRIFWVANGIAVAAIAFVAVDFARRAR